MDCPSVDDVTDNMKKLAYEKKLELIQDDIESLYVFCLKKGFSTNQIRDCFTPFVGKQESCVKRVAVGSSKSVLILSFIVLLAAIVVTWQPTQNMLIVHAKLLSAKTLYFYDWTKLYDQECLIDNVFLPERQITEEECYGCIDYGKGGSRIEVLDNVDKSKVAEEFLYADFPFVVTDTMRDWPISEDGRSVLSLTKIKELYMSHDSLKSGLEECQHHSSLKNTKMNVHEFFRSFDQITKQEKFHFSWENCDAKAAKVFRLFTKRPYFLPAMVEVSKSNQFVVAKGEFKDYFSFPQQVDSAAWFIVLSGSIKVKLSPIQDCMQFNCEMSTFDLIEGDAAVIPTHVWEVQYLATASNETTVVFASTIIWNQE